MKDCKNCGYRKYIAKMFDIHIDSYDCWLEKCLCETKEEEKEELKSIIGGKCHDS